MMIIEEKKDYVYITSNDKSLDNFVTNFKNEHEIIENKNIIISICHSFKVKEEDIFVFLSYSQKHRDNGTTFVLICNSVGVHDFPEEFNIVPTLQEAEDILEMEDIQRDLGF